MNDFVMIQRQLRRDRIDGKLSKNELNVLCWIFLSTNPTNGRFEASYEEIKTDCEIGNDNARKIISNLRRHKYLWFQDHKGRGGKFTIYPCNYQRTSKYIQVWEDFPFTTSQVTTTLKETKQDTQLLHNLATQNHNLNETKKTLTERFSSSSEQRSITASYTDNDTKNDNLLSIATKGKRIDVKSFNPKSWEEERCWTMAKELGETDMRFILSAYRKYGVSRLEATFGLVREGEAKINNKAAYFNRLISQQGELYDESGNGTINGKIEVPKDGISTVPTVGTLKT